MLKISNVNVEGVSSKKKNNAAVRSNKAVASTSMCSTTPLRSLASDQFKSSLNVAFKGGRPQLPKHDDLGDENYTPPAVVKTKQILIGPDSMQIVSTLPPHKMQIAPYYNTLADDVAILASPNKNALLLSDEGVSNELLTHKFTMNIQEGKYKREGFLPGKTDVVFMDAKKLMTKHGVFPDSLVSNMADVKDGHKKVIFVKNFEQFMTGLVAQRKQVSEFLSEGNLPNTHIIGIIPKKVHKVIQEGKSEVLLPADIADLGTVDFDGLGTSDAKELLKKDARLTGAVLGRYTDKNLQVTEQAVQEIVERSATKIDGSFPSKALKVLDVVASAKLARPTHHKTGAENIITSTDVKKVFEDQSELLNSLVVKDGHFKIAENVKTKLSDVGGIKDIKETLNDGILAYLKDPKKFTASGQKAPKGILMHGEPGTGKTLIARAIAGEAGVPFISASGSEFVEKYVGVGAQRVRELFDGARKAAATSEKKAAIIFIDEIDSIGKKRSGEGAGGSDESEKTLNQLLTEMDGFQNKDSKVKIIVMAATNREDIIDPALKRPGRFDDVLEVPAPSGNIEAREEILAIHAKGKAFASPEEKTKIIKEAAKITDGMSGAELAEVMTKAAKVVAKRPDNKVITHNDIVEGFLQVISGPVKKLTAFSDEENVATVRHEGGHAVAIATLQDLAKEKISFVTLEPRGKFLGAVYHHKTFKDVPDFRSVIASMAISYSGGLAEPSFKEHGHGAGVSGDFDHISTLANNAITKWGLGVHTPQMAIDEKGPLFKVYEHEIKKDTALLTATAQKVGTLITEFHKGFLDEYIDKFKANTGKGGNNLSGEEFGKLRQDWLVRTGKDKKLPALQKKINKIIQKAQNTNKSSLTVAKEWVTKALKLA